MRWVQTVKQFSYHMPCQITPTPCQFVVMWITCSCLTHCMLAIIIIIITTTPRSHQRMGRWKTCPLVHTSAEKKEEMDREYEVIMWMHMNHNYPHVIYTTHTPDCPENVHNSNSNSNNNYVRICCMILLNLRYCLSYRMPCTPLMLAAEVMRQQAKVGVIMVPVI